MTCAFRVRVQHTQSTINISTHDENTHAFPKRLRIQHPIHWQMSSDGTRMIGHISFRRSIDGDEILGLKVAGGRMTASGRRAAFIEKVKANSLADVEVHLQPGNIHPLDAVHLCVNVQASPRLFLSISLCFLSTFIH